MSPNISGANPGSRAFLNDIGGLVSRHVREEDDGVFFTREKGSRARSPIKFGDSRRGSRKDRPVMPEVDEEPVKVKGPEGLSFSDAGGLLR
jgi:hypothetical protein